MEVGVVREHLPGDLGETVAGQPEAVEVGEAAHFFVGHLAHPILAEVKRSQVDEAGQSLGDLNQESNH